MPSGHVVAASETVAVANATADAIGPNSHSETLTETAAVHEVGSSSESLSTTTDAHYMIWKKDCEPKSEFSVRDVVGHGDRLSALVSVGNRCGDRQPHLKGCCCGQHVRADVLTMLKYSRCKVGPDCNLRVPLSVTVAHEVASVGRDIVGGH
jgi:hypothetical protein